MPVPSNEVDFYLFSAFPPTRIQGITFTFAVGQDGAAHQDNLSSENLRERFHARVPPGNRFPCPIFPCRFPLLPDTPLSLVSNAFPRIPLTYLSNPSPSFLIRAVPIALSAQTFHSGMSRANFCVIICLLSFFHLTCFFLRDSRVTNHRIGPFLHCPLRIRPLPYNLYPRIFLVSWFCLLPKPCGSLDFPFCLTMLSWVCLCIIVFRVYLIAKSIPLFP